MSHRIVCDVCVDSRIGVGCGSRYRQPSRMMMMMMMMGEDDKQDDHQMRC